MATANAWLITLSRNLRVAVGEFEMIHVIPDLPPLFEVPRAPSYCRHVTIWERKIVPVMDLARRLLGDATLTACSGGDNSTFLAIVARQPEKSFQYGALVLSSVPARVQVDDDQACTLAEPLQGWRALALSCFEHEEYGPIPILNLAHIFGACVRKRQQKTVLT
jgi:chemotaxis signal transduction protein